MKGQVGIMGAKQLTLNLDDELNMGHLVAVRQLLDQGVDVNGRNSLGDTPLLTAAYTGQPDAIRLLLEYGADRNISNPNRHGKNAEELAQEMGYQEVLAALTEPTEA